MYDRKLRQEAEYQIIDFRIKQAQLWREDVKDIVGLTSVKMDTYLIVNAVQLGFCVMAFCEGRLASGTPPWIIGCHTLCLGGAFMYLLTSVWLSMHASVTAKAYEVRLLTQHVRLPVPTWAQVEGARTYGSAFEKVNTTQMLRVPFVCGSQSDVLRRSLAGRRPGTVADSCSTSYGPQGEGDGPSGTDEAVSTSDLWGLEARGDDIYELDGKIRNDPRNMRHLRLVHEAMQYWQSFDGFARVSMSMGTNQLIAALAYYVIGYVLVVNRAVVACWLAILLFMVITAALIRLDMSLTVPEYRTAVLLTTSGPLVAALAAQQWQLRTISGDQMVRLLAPIVYISHVAWLAFLLRACKVSEQATGALLPTGFRSVMYIDVFGWIQSLKGSSRFSGRPASEFPEVGRPEHATDVSGVGPAVQAVRYDGGRPIPSRPEKLLGSAQAPQSAIRPENFEPETFIPCVRENEADRADEKDIFQSGGLDSRQRASILPWKTFLSATSLLIGLWLLSGAFILAQCLGYTGFKVAPLLREDPSAEAANLTLIQSHTSVIAGGKRLEATWPRSHVQPHAIACAKAGKSDYVVALGRFGVFAASLRKGNESAMTFSDVPCGAIEGETLRDVAVICESDGLRGDGLKGNRCSAFVLHRQGQLVSACGIESPSAVSRQAEGETANATHFADSWLEDNGELGPEEQVSSLTLAVGGMPNRQLCADATASSGICAFAATTHGRIVEVRAPMRAVIIRNTSGSMLSHPNWSPSRVVRTSVRLFDGPSSTGADSGHGILRVVEASAGYPYIGTVRGRSQAQGGGQVLDAMDAVTGKLLSTWRLPEVHGGNGRWASFCSSGENLYLLTDGPDPQVWKFPSPQLHGGPLSENSRLPPADYEKQGVSRQTNLVPDSGAPDAGGLASASLAGKVALARKNADKPMKQKLHVTSLLAAASKSSFERKRGSLLPKLDSKMARVRTHLSSKFFSRTSLLHFSN